ncbi:MAG: fructosamine kinase family protein [Allosphingosinicella sp.]
MSAFARRVAALVGVDETSLERLAGGDLSEIFLVRREDGHESVAKGGPASGVEAAMLRTLAATVPAPRVEAEYDGILLLERIAHDGLFSANAWADIGACLARLHARHGDHYGWPADYALGSVQLDNRQRDDWPGFWTEQRLVATASLLDRPWRERVYRLVSGLGDRLPPRPPPALLHGDLWTGNILVRGGRLAALIDPACCHGHAEVDLAMLTLFDTPPEAFWSAYGDLEPEWRERGPIYQLFPALVHLRLFGAGYAELVNRLLTAAGA